jgi:hypothetical protein
MSNHFESEEEASMWEHKELRAELKATQKNMMDQIELMNKIANERDRLQLALEEALEGPDVIRGGFGAREDHDDFVKRIRAIAEGKKP